LRLETLGHGPIAVDGTPTDCVNIAITHVLTQARSHRVGHQQGWNLGDDVTYSGTVSGALEGALLGIPSIAVSAQRLQPTASEFGPSAQAAALVAEAVLDRGCRSSCC
jgi:5'-nucleotidase